MEEPPEQIPSEGSKLHEKVQFQSLDDFIKDTEPIESGKELNGLPRRPEQPPTKRQKKAIDSDALAAEEEAVKEMGDTNWIGKLNGVCIHILETRQLTCSKNIEVLILQLMG